MPTSRGGTPRLPGALGATYDSRFVVHRRSWSAKRASPTFIDAGILTPLAWRSEPSLLGTLGRRFWQCESERAGGEDVQPCFSREESF